MRTQLTVPKTIELFRHMGARRRTQAVRDQALHPLLGLQKGVRNHGMLRLIGGGVLQAKLRAEPAADTYEQDTGPSGGRGDTNCTKAIGAATVRMRRRSRAERRV